MEKNYKILIIIKTFIALCTLSLSILISSQTRIKDYPEGLYESFEDFSQKLPSKTNFQLTVETRNEKITDYKF